MTLDELKALRIGQRIHWAVGGLAQTRGEVILVTAAETRIRWTDGNTSIYRYDQVSRISLDPLSVLQ